MTSRQSAAAPIGPILAAVGCAVPAVLLAMGAARLASLSGELPVYDPTPAEIETWNTGNTLLALGGVVLLVWSLLVVLLRARLALTPGATALTVAGGIVASGLVAGVVWMTVLPPLPVG